MHVLRSGVDEGLGTGRVHSHSCRVRNIACGFTPASIKVLGSRARAAPMYPLYCFTIVPLHCPICTVMYCLQVDLEAWFPASQTYRELVSGSNCTDYQVWCQLLKCRCISRTYCE